MSERTNLQRIALWILLLSALLAGLLLISRAVRSELSGNAPDVVTIERPGLFPEGVEFDTRRDRFLVGSLSEGTIYEVREDGAPTPFINDPELTSSVGLQIDVQGDRLLVVSSNTFLFMDPTLPFHSKLFAYNLESGERLFVADLAALSEDAPNVANDVAVDSDGNAYVTDSLAPVIYQVDAAGNATVFYQNSLLDGRGEPGLNGIEYHPDGYLLVPMQGKLLKMPVANPAATSEVLLDQPIPAADGVTLHPDGRLIVVQGQLATVTALASEDGWESAVTAETSETDLDGTATTATVRGNDIYVVYSRILSILQGAETPEAYEIVRVHFGEE